MIHEIEPKSDEHQSEQQSSHRIEEVNNMIQELVNEEYIDCTPSEEDIEYYNSISEL